MSASFAQRLDLLFDSRYRPGCGPYTSIEVLSGVRRAGHRMSAPYLSQLRSGHRRRPSRATVIALAEFFGVSPAYFTDDDHFDWLAAELTQHAQLRDPGDGVRQVVERLGGLSPRALDEVARYVEELWLDQATSVTPPSEVRSRPYAPLPRQQRLPAQRLAQ